MWLHPMFFSTGDIYTVLELPGGGDSGDLTGTTYRHPWHYNISTGVDFNAYPA